MKKGLILINAYSQLPTSINQSKRLKEELEKLGVKTDVMRNDGFYAYINSVGDIESVAKQYNFCIYLDKDKYISEMLEKCGLRLFNSHKAITDCDDKMTTYIQLANNGIVIPKTYPGLLCYDPDEKVKDFSLDIVEKGLGYPLIVKSSYGSLGKEIYKVDNREQLQKVSEYLKCKPHLFQEFVGSSCGRDIRVIIIDGKFVACMMRKSEGDFRSNIEIGGEGYPIEITEELKNECVKISKLLNLDYCGIDILFGKKQGEYLVCEVNSNAFFGGIESVTGVNVAKEYAKHIIKEVYGE